MYAKNQTQRLNKEAIAVHNPDDPWERSLQNAYHEFNEGWMSSFACRLLAKATTLLKGEDWTSQLPLLPHRARFFFAPAFASNKDEMILVTFPLFLRDILENEIINSCLHDPVMFVTKPIAHYLFRDHPVHIHVQWSKLKEKNHDVKFIDVGGVIMSAGGNVVVEKDACNGVKFVSNKLQKAAAKEVKPGVYEIGEDVRTIHPDLKVWDKMSRRPGVIEEAGRGEEGLIKVIYESGETIAIPQYEFDHRFVLPQKVAQQQQRFPIKWEGQVHQLSVGQIERLIKQKMLASRTIKELFSEFDVSLDRLKDLRVMVANLDNKYAETDDKVMKLDISLFDDGDFFGANFFIVCHEIVHWLSRTKEADAYYNDPEEVLGFVMSIAYEMERGKDIQYIWDKIYPKISWHFNDEKDAQETMKRMVEKAKESFL